MIHTVINTSHVTHYRQNNIDSFFGNMIKAIYLDGQFSVLFKIRLLLLYKLSVFICWWLHKNRSFIIYSMFMISKQVLKDDH